MAQRLAVHTAPKEKLLPTSQCGSQLPVTSALGDAMSSIKSLLKPK